MLSAMSSSADDLAVVRRYARAGDPGAFEVLVRRYQGMVLATCRRILRTEADAEDAAQETFLKLARSAGSIRSNAAAWLHACAVRTSLDLARRDSTRARIEREAGPGQAAEPTWREVEPVLDAALARVGESERDLIVRRFLAGMPLHALASDAGISDGAMSRRIDKALTQLREQLRANAGVAVAAGSLPTLLEQVPIAPATPELTGSLVKTGLSCIGQAPVAGALGSFGKVAAILGIGLATIGGGGLAAYAMGVFGQARSIWGAGEPTYGLTNISRDGLASTVVECDGTRLEMKSAESGVLRGTLQLKIVAGPTPDKPGVLTVRLEKADVPRPNVFESLMDRDLKLSYEKKDDRLTLRLFWGEGRDDGTKHWIGFRAAGAAEPKAASDAPAPELVGVWNEASNWQLKIKPEEIGVWDQDMAIHRFKVLAWHDGDPSRVETICVQSMDQGLVGKRTKLLVRQTGDTCAVALHAPESGKLNEYPENFTPALGDQVMVMEWRKEAK